MWELFRRDPVYLIGSKTILTIVKKYKEKIKKNELKRKKVDGNKGVLNWKTNPDYMNNKAPLKFPNLLIKWDNKLTWIIL